MNILTKCLNDTLVVNDGDISYRTDLYCIMREIGISNLILKEQQSEHKCNRLFSFREHQLWIQLLYSGTRLCDID